MSAGVRAKAVVCAASGIAITILLIAAPVRAEGAFNLRDALFGRHVRDQPREFDAPTVARYRADAGQAFIFDRVGGGALLKYEDDPEVWALTPTPGPRGDVIYKNDVGQPMLRATRLGGVTLFTPDRPDGTAAAFLGQALAPRPPAVFGPEALVQLMFQASTRASRAAQHLVAFDAPEVTPASEAVFAQAFVITAEAFVRVSQRGKPGQKVLARVTDVRFLSGSGPSAMMHGPLMQITVAPQLGIAGRPSSQRIVEVIGR